MVSNNLDCWRSRGVESIRPLTKVRVGWEMMLPSAVILWWPMSKSNPRDLECWSHSRSGVDEYCRQILDGC